MKLFSLRMLGVLFACCQLAAMPAHARTERVIYVFCAQPCSNASGPDSDLVRLGEEFYGTTAYGGDLNCLPDEGCGTVYSVTSTGAEKVVYAFQGGSDGAYPSGGLTNLNGTFYGTTYSGGSGTVCAGTQKLGCGTVFSVTPAGVEKVIHSFQGGADGAGPNSRLIKVGEKLYGTTVLGGGGTGCGTVFAVSSTGTEKVVYAFRGGSDGYYPLSGLVNVNGVLYGTTSGGGGKQDSGIVFSVTPEGVEKVIYSFCAQQYCADGAGPGGALINVGGTLYGTTTYGGGTSNFSNCYPLYGCGVVYSVTTTGTEKVVYAFQAGSDGANPEDGVIDLNGALLGTTNFGGTGPCAAGCGTVFSVSTAGIENVLYSFGSVGDCDDGCFPKTGLLGVGGRLYGTTTTHGPTGSGTVFSMVKP